MGAPPPVGGWDKVGPAPPSTALLVDPRQLPQAITNTEMILRRVEAVFFEQILGNHEFKISWIFYYFFNLLPLAVVTLLCYARFVPIFVMKSDMPPLFRTGGEFAVPLVLKNLAIVSNCDHFITPWDVVIYIQPVHFFLYDTFPDAIFVFNSLFHLGSFMTGTAAFSRS